jgi:hypothetical protein
MAAPRPAWRVRLRRDPVAVALCALGAFVVYQSSRLSMRSLDGGPGPGLMPIALGVLSVGLGAWILLAGGDNRHTFGNLRRVALMGLVLGLYAVGLEHLGFVATAALATVMLLLSFQRRPPVPLIALGIAGAVVCYALFYSALKVQLPPDPLGLWR